MTWEVHPFYRCPTVCCVGGWKLLYKHCEIYTGWQAGSYGTRFFFPPLLLLHSWCRYTPLKVVSNVFVVVMMHWCLLQPSRTWMWFCFFGPAYVAVTSVWILMMWHLWLRWQLQKKRFPEISKKPNNVILLYFEWNVKPAFAFRSHPLPWEVSAESGLSQLRGYFPSLYIAFYLG